MSETPRVLISDALSPRAAAILRDAGIGVDVRAQMPGDLPLEEIVSGYDAILVRSATKLTADLIGRATRLKVIGRAGIGVDNIDVSAASSHGVVVMNTPFGNATTTAEHAIAMLMSVTRNIPQATASMRAGRWDKKKYKGREVTGKTLGIAGLGNIGRIVADRALGLRMKVVAYDPFLTADAADRLGVEKVTFEQLLERADYVTIHTPLIDQTRNLIDAAALARMKKGAFLICCARGGIVDESALLEALESGHLGGAALDVFLQEPPQADHPLLQHPKIILTPHLGASTNEAQEAVAVQIAEQLVAYFDDGTITNALNAWSISGDELRQVGPWLSVAAKLGALAGQVHTGEVERIEVGYHGPVADLGREPMTAHVVSEILNQGVFSGVNAISARAVARDRGISVAVSTSEDHPEFTNLVTVGVAGGGKQTSVHGLVFGKRALRVVSLDGYRLDLVPSGWVMVVNNEDRPGMIGAVGSLLGSRGINVSRLTVGLREPNGKALAVWATDAKVSDEVAEAIAQVDGIVSLRRLRL